MVQQWDVTLQKRSWDVLSPPKKKLRTLKTFEKLYSWHLKIDDLVQMMFLFNYGGGVHYVVSYQNYLKQPCINLWFDMTRRVLNFGSDYIYCTLVSDVIKLFCHKIPGRHWWKTTRCTKTQRLPTEFCGILAGIGFCHARDFAWESHHFLGVGCVCRYLNSVCYMISTW